MGTSSADDAAVVKGDGQPDAPALDSAGFERPQLASYGTLELERTAARDARRRSLARQPHVAELFHQNSKLSPAWRSSIEPSDVIDQLRRWFLTQSYQPEPGPTDERLVAMGALTEPATWPLRPFWAAGSASDALFAVDVWFVAGGAVYRQLPGRASAWLELALPDEERTHILEALAYGETGSGGPFCAFLVGNPWRYMTVLGPRGYRRMLIDAGVVVGHLSSQRGDGGTGVGIITEFDDDAINEALTLDGVERYVVAVAVSGPGGGDVMS